jgi:Flp pilus assembly protein TadD
VRLRPQYVEAWNMLGNNLKDQGDVDGAIEALKQSVALDATNAGAYNSLGLLLRKKGNTEEAKQAFAKAAELRRGEQEKKQKSLQQGMGAKN